MEQSPRKILIIDDDEMILKSLVNLFEMEKFQVFHAHDGDEGLREAFIKEPDLIITDIDMENLSGISVLHEVRKGGDWGAKVPIIMFTNFDGDGEEMAGIERDHPSFFLKKSEVAPAEILAKVKELLQ